MLDMKLQKRMEIGTQNDVRPLASLPLIKFVASRTLAL